MSFTFELAAFFVGTVWLIVLTFILLRLISYYNNLTRGASSKSLMSILDDLVKDLRLAQKDIAFLQKRCDTLEKEGFLHIQKIGLLRFNPFKDTGGDQSFILSLVDGNSSGVVISGLYSRIGTRWYAKRVLNGKGVDHDLSEEEKKALKEGKNSNSDNE